MGWLLLVHNGEVYNGGQVEYLFNFTSFPHIWAVEGGLQEILDYYNPQIDRG